MIAKLFVGIVLILTALVCSVVIVLFPLGLAARFALILAAIFLIILAWGFRSKTNHVPHGFVFSWMMLITFFSVVWPRYIYFSVGSLPRVNPQTLSVILGLGIVLLLMINSPKFSKRVLDTYKQGGAIIYLAFAWFVWRFIANFLGEYPIPSTLDYLRELLYLATFILFGIVIASYDNGPKSMTRLIMISAIFVGIAGVVEAFQQKNIFVGFASQDVEGGVSKIIGAIASEKLRSGVYRAQSTFDHPIVFAQFFAALLPLALYGFLYEKQRLWKLASFVIIPIALLAILKSGSRAGIISFAVALGFLGILFWFRAIVHGRITKFIAILALPVLVVAIGLGYLALQQLAMGHTQNESSSSAVRLVMLNTGIAALWDSPLWGFGQGMALVKAGVINTVGLATIDNYLLTIALDSGYVGLLIFITLMSVFGYQGFKYAVINQDANGMFVGACVAGALAIFTTFGILSIPNNMTLMWLLITATFPFIGNEPSISSNGDG